ncbi:DUF2812 domain-containing protein [Butyrivibrio sp. AE2032]|uniref:DUF2812 domain-containing protein n=1 Tax=Butyrivibrio sp. AE2032 TaxID=1458463 RepID=UPI00068FECA4|nr:DUF2812 domain-containing protein [Butyrivibrio sp. AE2032]
MRRVIHKLFWIWQLEKEQAWINEMASHGYSLEHAGRLTFEFEETEPNKYIYKEIFLKGGGESAENLKYFKFLEEMGIKVVCYINYPGTCWVYTRALKEEYPDGIELYSDIDSKINYQKVMAGYLIFVIAFTLFAALLNTSIVVSSLLRNNMLMTLNLICAILMLALCVASVIAAVKAFIKIGNLKKERKIHE